MNKIVRGKSTLHPTDCHEPRCNFRATLQYIHFSKAVPIIVATGQEPLSCNSHLFDAFVTLRIKGHWWWIDGASETDLGREMVQVEVCSHHRRIPCLPQCLMAEGWERRDPCPISVTYPHLQRHRYVMVNHIISGRSLVESLLHESFFLHVFSFCSTYYTTFQTNLIYHRTLPKKRLTGNYLLVTLHLGRVKCCSCTSWTWQCAGWSSVDPKKRQFWIVEWTQSLPLSNSLARKWPTRPSIWMEFHSWALYWRLADLRST